MAGPGAAGGRLRLGAPLLVLLVALGLTAGAWQVTQTYSEEQARLRFEADAAQIEFQVLDRMGTYEQVLLGGKAMFLAANNVTRQEWAAYVKVLRLDERLPGTQGVGFAQVIPRDRVAEHEARVRAEGFPNYTVYPSGERPVVTSIVYIEPFTGRNLRAFGYDMYSDPVRRAAMEEARDEGRAALSGKVTLVQEDETDVQPGVLMYVPLYSGGLTDPGTVETRRQTIEGWVYSPFRTHDLMEGIIAGDTPSVRFLIYDGEGNDPASLLYDSDPGAPLAAGDAPWERRTSVLNVSGRQWTLLAVPDAHTAEPGIALLPTAILVSGLVTSALLFGIALSLHATRERAVRIAEGMTTELRRSKRELEVTNEALRAFSYVVSHDLKEPVRAVEAYLTILREDHGAEMPRDAAALAAKAHDSTLRLSALLQGLLELSSVDRGTLVRQPVTVQQVVASEACRLAYERLQAERGARIDVEPSPPALGSVSVLAQAVGNLVGNAIRHNAAAEPVVLLTGARTGDGLVEWTVEDNGAGYPEGLAEAFNAGSPRSGGFGLLIAQRAVERLGGRLRLGRSDRLGGAKATLTLPAAPQDREAA